MWHSILCHYASYVWDLVPAHLVFMFAPGLWTPKTRVWQCRRAITIQREQYGATIHLFIGTGRSLDEITFMSLTFTVNHEANYRGIDSLFPFKSVSPFTSLMCWVEAPSATSSELACPLFKPHLYTTHTFVLKPKLPETVYYTGKHVSYVFEDLRKRKSPSTTLLYFIPCSPLNFWVASATGLCGLGC